MYVTKFQVSTNNGLETTNSIKKTHTNRNICLWSVYAGFVSWKMAIRMQPRKLKPQAICFHHKINNKNCLKKIRMKRLLY